MPVLGSQAYDDIAYAGDADAIAWFFANVSGSPVVAEASIGPYRCHGSRISAATGLPTIIGWERHQQQQRYPDTLPARVADVRTLYTSTDIDEKESILRRYNVEYVVVGDLERVYPLNDNDCTPTGSQAGIEAFDAMVGATLEVAHSSRGTTIYRVLPVRPALTWRSDGELGRSRGALVPRPGGRHLGLCPGCFLALPRAPGPRGNAGAADRDARRGLSRLVACVTAA